MNETKDLPSGLILLSHPMQLRISAKEMVDALPETHRSLHHPDVDLDMGELARQAVQTGDWSEAQRTLEERFRTQVVPLQGKYPNYQIVYFGSAPIPLTVLLGFLLETWQQVTVIPHHHTRRVWDWVSEPGQPPARLAPVSLPDYKDRSDGEAIIRVSTSHSVDPLLTRKVVPDALVELDIALEHPAEDAFTRLEEMQEVALRFRAALDVIGDQFENIQRVHLFASVQPGMALLLGAQISRTMHPAVLTYQYARHLENGPYHVPAILVNGPPRPEPVPLTEQQVSQAASDRANMVRDLDRMAGLANRWEPPAYQSWFAGLLPKHAEHPAFFGPWKHLPTLYQTPLLKTQVDVSTQAVADSFRLAPPHNHWQLDDHWLARLARRLPKESQRQRALRLLVLHELAHRGPQMLTRNSSQEIGRFPRVLEEIDLQADVWAMLHEYELTRSLSPRELSDVPRFFMEVVQAATEAMWAFDDEGPPLREIQIRRLNRYLIWYWQYLRLEQLAGRSQGGTLDDVLSLLTQRPSIELAGPRIFTRDERVFFSLEARHVKEPELAVYHEGRLTRHGPRPDFSIDALLDGVRERDGEKIRKSLRGAFEPIVR